MEKNNNPMKLGGCTMQDVLDITITELNFASFYAQIYDSFILMYLQLISYFKGLIKK